MTDEAREFVSPSRARSRGNTRQVRALKALACAMSVSLALWAGTAAARKSGGDTPPPTLRDTGLYSDFAQHTVATGILEYSPQYPLWSDGAAKRRWISLPRGSAIDGANPDAWVFPKGTKFWKEFAFGGRRVETRYLERRQDGTWLYATYAWSDDEHEAVLVSEQGKPGAYTLGEGVWHTIPSVNDCKTCHQGGRTEVLGFDALQLSPDRDPNAPHAEPAPAPGVDLNYLVKNQLLKHLPRALLDTPPRIAASTPTERAALGYLHGNCGHCHNDVGLLKNLDFSLHHIPLSTPPAPERAMATAVGQPIKARASGQTLDALLRVEPGAPERSVVVQRVGSRYPALQMPPLGTVLVDEQALALLARWIAETPKPAAASGLSGNASSTTP